MGVFDKLAIRASVVAHAARPVTEVGIDQDNVPSEKVLSGLLEAIKKFDRSIVDENTVTQGVSPWLNVPKDSKAYRFLKRKRIYSVTLFTDEGPCYYYVMRSFGEEAYIVAIRKDNAPHITPKEALRLAITQFVLGIRGTTYKDFVEMLDGKA